MKIFTAAPLPVSRDSWDRDITLIYRGLRDLGVESQCVRLHTVDGAEFSGVIQTSRENMCSAEWWRKHELDAVVLNSWGNPEHTPIVRAIKNAGAKILVRLDTNGLNSPWINPLAYGRCNFSAFRDQGCSAFRAGLATVAKLPLYAIPHVYDLKSLAQFELVDFVGVESEESYSRMSRLFKFYRRSDLQKKLQIVRHPAAPDVLKLAAGQLPEKQKSIVAVGRWQAHQKNAPLLASALVSAFGQNREYEAELIGSGAEYLDLLLAGVAAPIRSRIHVRGSIPHSEIADRFMKSRICFLTSRYESGPLVASEALCCGCTFFAQDNGMVPLNAIRAMDAGGGVSGGAMRLANGLLAEMNRWDAGGYDPERIATDARKVFSYRQIAEKVQALFKGTGV